MVNLVTYEYQKGIGLHSPLLGKNNLHPVHPGEVLLEEFLKPVGLSQNRLALNIGVPARRINEIVLEKRKITADTALRLAKFFGTSAEFWLGLQSQYDIDVTADEIGERCIAAPLSSDVICSVRAK
ncbi:MAG: HigA family addiction module antitoxin [Syntrophales bacterium]|nr:HigA family addiction module antitoxin [Syntrophales bacterium]